MRAVGTVVGTGCCQLESIVVMAGLVPAIHVFELATLQDVDARPKAGHDGVI